MRVTDKTDLEILAQTPLFDSLSLSQIEEATAAIKCDVVKYERGSIVMHSGDPTDSSSLIMRGRADILTAPNLDGSQKIIVQIGVGEMYGEPFNCLSYSAEPITVIATTSLKVLKIDIRTIFDAECDKWVARQLLTNLAIQFAEKIIVFRNKVEVLSQPNLKMKILTTIKQYAEYQNTIEPAIPFTQASWANYLNANRNTIARNMKKLQEEGYVHIRGKHYRLLKTDNLMFVQRSSRSPQNVVHAKVKDSDRLA